MMNPTEPTMTCDQLADVLAQFLEHEVDESTRARVEAHAASCLECSALVEDLRKLRVDAANLPTLAPSRDLWAGIAARIETPVVEIVPGRGVVDRFTDETVDRPVASRRRLVPMWAGLAAAGIVAITAAVTHELTKRTIVVSAPVATTIAAAPVEAPADSTAAAPLSSSAPVARSTPAPAPADSTVQRSSAPVGTLVADKPSAEETYDREIKRLRAIVTARRSALDTTTIRVIDHNLQVIDDAIAQCRAALARDPASRFLLESLNDALDTKVHLLRTAAMLPSRS